MTLRRRTLTYLAAIYLTPLVAYVATFGTEISSQHVRWSEFGSAMSGIYAPIIALSTLAVLFVQVRLQSRLNDHEFRQAHISQARADIEFYATQLAKKLEEIANPGKPMRAVLHLNFRPDSVAELDSESLRALAANIDALAPSILGMWFGIYPILSGLRTGEQQFEMTLYSSLQKLNAMLSFETCIALDNYHRARTEGKLRMQYEFSPLLSGKNAV